MSFLKSINVSDLEESKSIAVIDYKKLSITKLRTIVTEKGIVNNASKLKKEDILKLLESE